jgi:hypothetical protein
MRRQHDFLMQGALAMCAPDDYHPHCRCDGSGATAVRPGVSISTAFIRRIEVGTRFARRPIQTGDTP